MHIDIVSVGKTKTMALATLEQMYLQRSRPFFQMQCWYYKTEAKVLEYIQRHNFFYVLLDETGTTYTSRQLADQLQRWQTQYQQISFIVGDSAGVSLDIIRACSTKLSLSALTFPHEIARVLLLEQLYRAGTIWKNHPYHK